MNMGRNKMRPRKIGMPCRTLNSIEEVILIKCVECVSTAKKSYKLRIDRKRKYALQTLKSRLLSNALLLLQQKSNLVIGMQFDLSISVEIIWFRAVTLKFYLNHSRGCKIWQRKLLIKMCHLFLKFSIIISRLLIRRKHSKYCTLCNENNEIYCSVT